MRKHTLWASTKKRVLCVVQVGTVSYLFQSNQGHTRGKDKKPIYCRKISRDILFEVCAITSYTFSPSIRQGLRYLTSTRTSDNPMEPGLKNRAGGKDVSCQRF